LEAAVSAGKIPPRFGSLLFNKNFFAETLTLCMPFALATAFERQRWWWRLFGALAVMAVPGMLLLLQSMSSWLAFGTGAVAAALVAYRGLQLSLYRKRVRLVFAAALVVSLSVACAWWFSNASAAVRGKVATALQAVVHPDRLLNERKYYNSYTERLLVWQHTWRMVKDHPVAGAGTANWKIKIPFYGSYGIAFMDSGR
jgi:O-antigen ligase